MERTAAERSVPVFLHPAGLLDGYTPGMSIDRILISLGVLLLVVGAVLAAIAWL